MEVAAGRQANMTLRIPHPRLRAALVVVAGCAIALGLVARIAHFDDTMLADELSTLYIVHDHSLRDVLHLVRSDAEISPPLYFVLAWICAQFGSASELIRLPALVAGLASIPLAFLLARRLFGTSAGLVAAALMALNPFMVYYSTEARPYTVRFAGGPSTRRWSRWRCTRTTRHCSCSPRSCSGCSGHVQPLAGRL